MKADDCRKIGVEFAEKMQHAKTEEDLQVIQMANPLATLLINCEIAAQLAELNENLNRLFAKEDKVNPEVTKHDAAALRGFTAGLKPMGVNGK